MGIFDPEHKTNAHIFELLLIMGAVGLTVGRMIRADMPMTRADTIALGMTRSTTITRSVPSLPSPSKPAGKPNNTTLSIRQEIKVVSWVSVGRVSQRIPALPSTALGWYDMLYVTAHPVYFLCLSRLLSIKASRILPLDTCLVSMDFIDTGHRGADGSHWSRHIARQMLVGSAAQENT
ncbi:hypothetical protein AUP68_08564 [Ilyonectria robusta]